MDLHACHGRCNPKSTITLPADCVHAVIGHLPFNHDILQRCALVCHLWAYLCQQRLFNRICVQIRSSRTGSEPARRLLEILSRSPHIGEHVRSLELVTHEDLSSKVGGAPDTSLEQQAMATILPHFHQLSSLSLNGREKSTTFPPFLKALRITLASPHLAHLNLSHWRFADLQEMTNLMGTYPRSLESLNLTYISFKSLTGYVEASDTESILKINSLEVDFCDLIGIVGWILSFKSFFVKKLVLRNNDEPDFSSTQSAAEDINFPYIQLFSPHLEELSLPRLDHRLPMPLNFSELNKLRVLSLKELDFNLLLESLETFHRDNSLETLEILPAAGANVVSELRKLDQLLSSTHAFPSLKLVRICIRVRNVQTEAIKEALGLLIERGLLHLDSKTFASIKIPASHEAFLPLHCLHVKSYHSTRPFAAIQHLGSLFKQ